MRAANNLGKSLPDIHKYMYKTQRVTGLGTVLPEDFEQRSFIIGFYQCASTQLETKTLSIMSSTLHGIIKAICRKWAICLIKTSFSKCVNFFQNQKFFPKFQNIGKHKWLGISIPFHTSIRTDETGQARNGLWPSFLQHGCSPQFWKVLHLTACDFSFQHIA